MARFDQKTWNDAVFQKYMQKVDSPKLNSMIKSGVLKVNNGLKSRLVDGVGGNKLIEPISGLLDGQVVNYDGNTNITTSSRNTFSQTKIVVGRAKGWEEKDFSTDLTGVNWMAGVAGEVAEYYEGIDQDDILAILKGVFSMSDTEGAKFVAAHTTDITSDTNANVGATTLNSAIQKASGDRKSIFRLAFMHSLVATNLENLQLLEYLKYTDANGIQRDLGMATWNGRLVIIDDEMPTEDIDAVYEATSDTEVDATKTYYTRSGSGTTQSPYVYTEVASPVKASLSSYYEMTAAAYTTYTTYVLGEGAIEYCNIGAKVPSEVARDAATNGGVDKLYTRQRKLFAPKWISWVGSSAIISPTNAQLATGSNWEIVNDGETNKTYVNHKFIPFVRIISRG